MIYINEGPYLNGCFKFNIQFDKKFPFIAPTIQFKSKIFHPLISEKHGFLDLTVI